MTTPGLPTSEHEPFVLLDDASADGEGRSLLFRDPVGVVRADTMAQVMPALAEVARAADYGLHAAGYISYTAGHAFEPRTAGYQLREGDTGPLLWFGMFEAPVAIPSAGVPDLLPAPDFSAIGAVTPMVTRESYGRSIGKVLDYIVAGDIYQANLTFPASIDVPGNPFAAYAAIRPRQKAAHGALIRHDGRHILSFSPERFFAMEGRRIFARPMKGTARREPDPAADAAAIAELASDPKQRAENLMIVDLLRNDISRVALPGSVKVPTLFAVETYPTIHQLISVVEGEVRPGLWPDEVIRALFPCGSITGAPKIRAMDVIAEVEPFGRGLYTGSIGHIDPKGAARFNVAIRTISLESGAKSGILGLGSGIVADSQPDAEWQECLDKARFVTAR